MRPTSNTVLHEKHSNCSDQFRVFSEPQMYGKLEVGKLNYWLLKYPIIYFCISPQILLN